MTSISNLKLRPMSQDDFKTYYQLVSDPKIAQGARFQPAKDWSNAKELFKDDLNHAMSYAVILNDEMIGMVSLYTTVGSHGEPNQSCLELADMMLPKYQNHGYMGKTLGMLINRLKAHSHVQRLVALVAENNVPSRKVLLKNHFHNYRSVLNMAINQEDLVYQLDLRLNS
ncbi:GNAT family N-acetyltransferase [Acetilactobacillus jinshanensis]|uniref:N-acetyltransferase n=1 Tax=Acetilactobacillus jinshanensis TaxID=1720083 RepID=A0A4P6ZK66_9LACO|nr:GNAT family N-acetyltransferase [Acetilactobacillus jinshanensis]QBP17812.1 N-acetyltransferase [Acetilactobacillus jinshanensis]URL60674.1 GNAT family N-acetyltransferase [uncultured bacterium]